MRPFDLRHDRAAESLARELESLPDYRILRRLPVLREMWVAPTPPRGPNFVLGVIDTETTGLGDDAKIIEFSLIKVSLTSDGTICDIGLPMTQLEDPGVPLTAEIEAITGISDEMVHGRRFDDRTLADAIEDVDAFVAFNAAFDAKMWRRRFPGHGHPWICALRDFDWAASGHNERSLSSILAAKGHFYPAHRAEADAWALAVLLCMHAPDRRTIAAHVVDTAKRTEHRVLATGAPFSIREQLKVAGYRWRPARRVWTIDVAPDRVVAEFAMLDQLHPMIKPTSEEIDWFNRHLD